ncbi:hypothetical protein FA13DRAFT_1725486 [Coprinellus micaceus]|jgi:uncharacterized protein (UPF0332 family)|uniref:FAD-binding domain-containing protein n=1 Tax=Coprinellus micaceus TaxID=71717 RepID=A0A4Y7TWB9_COPMI|nr:hypothetical protein FA13DRAFT_1725486 [Coprinellus micaceus]
MHDALDLSVALGKIAFEGGAIDEVLGKFEDQMFERASMYSAFCMSNQEAWYSGKSAKEVVDQITNMFGWAK